MSANRSRALAGLAIAVIVAVCVAACGSSSSTSTSSASSSAAATSTGGAAKRAKLLACLKQHGVTLLARPGGGGYGPRPGSANGNGQGNTGTANGYHNGRGGGRLNNPQFRAAFKACGGTAGFRGGQGNFRPSSAAITQFAACVKQHGYTLPKANLTGRGPVYPLSIERNAKFQAASRACQSLLRAPGTGAPPGAGAPPEA